MGKSVFDYIAPLAGAALGGFGLAPVLGVTAATGSAIGAGIGSGLSTGVQTGDPLAGLISGAASGAGSYLGSQILGPELSAIGGSTNAVSGSSVPGFMGQELGGFAGNVISGTPGNIAGSAIGSNLAGSAANSLIGDITAPNSSGLSVFEPKRNPQMSLPSSLNDFSGFDPSQQSSGIATQGVYGGGAGPEETNYFLNLINRRLVDDSGNVGSVDQINPIETSFLSQIGLGGYGSSNDLLEAIGRYRT